MITEIIRMMCRGVVLLITKVKRLRKNRVAFGFRTLHKNPILKASNRVKSIPVFCSEISSFELFEKNELNPM